MIQLTAFVLKEFRHIFRDRWTMVILLLLPVVMLILFGFAISTEVKNASFVYYDPVKADGSRAIVDRLDASRYFRCVGELRSPSEIERAFDRGRASLVLVFGDGAVNLIADGTDPNIASTVVHYAASVIGAETAASRIETDVRLLYNPMMLSAYNFVPGVMGMILMLICAMMTSISIAREKEKGTMEILLASPMNPLTLIMAKAVPYMVLSLVNLCTILLMSVFVLGVPVTGSIPGLFAVSFVYIFAALALGLLISSAANSQMVALLVSVMALMMPVILLSGMMFPVDQMPRPLQWISCLLPARWYISAVRKIMVKGLGMESIVREFAVLSVMAAVLVAAGLKQFKIRLE